MTKNSTIGLHGPVLVELRRRREKTGVPLASQVAQLLAEKLGIIEVRP